jgi:hypothetical protein
MLKKTIKFKNLDGQEVTETHYFNMTTAELVKMNMEKGEGFQDYLTKIVEAEDGAAIISVFDEVVGKTYGVRTSDGKFVKRPEDYEAFKASEAYSEFFMELVTNANSGAEFINAVMPADLLAKAQYAQQQESATVVEIADEPASSKKETNPRKMSRAELLAAYREKNAAKDVPVNPLKGMPLEQALELSPAEFDNWVALNQ